VHFAFEKEKIRFVFYLSKLAAVIEQPLWWVIALLVYAVLAFRRRPRAARWSLCVALFIALNIGWLAPPNAIIRALESKYAIPTADLAAYRGVIVLGGAFDAAYAWTPKHEMALNDSAERMVVALRLAQRYPAMKVLFTGGEGGIVSTGLSESDRARKFFDAMGLDAARVIYENQSRTTLENARLSAKLLQKSGVSRDEKWLLLTSAWHMPRAMLAFESVGWQVTPYPVDFRAGDDTPWTYYQLDEGATRWKVALHELIGLLAYRLVTL
jgi:uncharacterized SAM-binding protein YcdF (DUF218 family)